MSVDPSASSDLREPARSSRGCRMPQVLVVDDDAAMRAIARHLLEGAGYAVAEAKSGREGLARLRGDPLPDYLVADLRMADGSGGWLVAQVAYEFPALITRAVVITAAAASAAAAHLSARWGCPVVAKPYTGAELVETIVGLEDAQTVSPRTPPSPVS